MKVVKVPKFNNFDNFFSVMLPMGDFWNNDLGFDTMLYRGEPSAKFKLLPSALRDVTFGMKHGNRKPVSQPEQVRMEYYLLWDFYKLANENGLKVKASIEMQNNYLTAMSPLDSKDDSYKWLSPEYEELAALAQHYGVKTRMLDWSSDLYISLYFAAVGALKNWKKSFKSGWDDNSYDTNDSIVIYILNGGKVHEMAQKIPLKLIVPSYYDNPNLKAQKGVLSYWQVDLPIRSEEGIASCKHSIDIKPLTQLLEEHDLGYKSEHIKILYKVEIAINECGYIYSVMDKLGYNAARLFPGYDGVNRKLEEDELYLEFCSWINGQNVDEYNLCNEMYNNAVLCTENQKSILLDELASKYKLPKMVFEIKEKARKFLELLSDEDIKLLLLNIYDLPNGNTTPLNKKDSYCVHIYKWAIVYDMTPKKLTVYDINMRGDKKYET